MTDVETEADEVADDVAGVEGCPFCGERELARAMAGFRMAVVENHHRRLYHCLACNRTVVVTYTFLSGPHSNGVNK